MQQDSRRERAILVALDVSAPASRRSPSPDHHALTDRSESLSELVTLAASAGAEVVDQMAQRRERADAATLIGSGKVEELRAAVASSSADVIIFDNDLSPTQQRNLERALDVKIIDRTQLILDIFASRARTREGQLQVELAQLNYLLPRLTGRGIEMSRLGGGIGTRGPGETQLETDRRKIQRRIKSIEEDLERVRSSRSIQRRQRQAVPLATIALVGYTNAGKSTLFNVLTGAYTLAADQLFATLDTLTRRVQLGPRAEIVLSDTVGFVRELPHQLVAAFRATLEETAQADLLIHVVDASAPDRDEQMAQVERVLAEIGADEVPTLVVFNKVDLAGRAPEVHRGACGSIDRLSLSARTGAGVDALREALVERLASRQRDGAERADGATHGELPADTQPIPPYSQPRDPLRDQRA